MEKPIPQPESPPTPTAVVRRIAKRLGESEYGTGALAELRRLDPAGRLVQPAFYKLLVQNQASENWLSLRGWAVLIHSMALAAPDLLQGRTGLGRALFAAGYKEGRLLRLLEARSDDLYHAVPRMVRFLVAKGEQLDPVALAWFIRDIACGGERGDQVRARIASDYYRAEGEIEQSARSTSEEARRIT